MARAHEVSQGSRGTGAAPTRSAGMRMPWRIIDKKGRLWGSEYAAYTATHVDTFAEADGEVMQADKEAILRWLQNCREEDGRWVLDSAGTAHRYGGPVQEVLEPVAEHRQASIVSAETFAPTMEALNSAVDVFARSQYNETSVNIFVRAHSNGVVAASSSRTAGTSSNRSTSFDKIPRRHLTSGSGSLRTLTEAEVDRNLFRVTASDLDQGVPLLSEAGGGPMELLHVDSTDSLNSSEAEDPQCECDVFSGLDEMERQQVEVPIVQFGCARNFAAELDSVVYIEVFRIGNLERTSRVPFQTVDGSAKAGVIYKPSQGELVFEPGEHRKLVTVEVVVNDTWNPATEFGVHLLEQGKVNAVLGRYLWEARVSIIDNNVFPTNHYRAQLDSVLGDRRPYFLGQLGDGISKPGLLFEFLKLNFRHPVVKPGSIKMLLVDLLQNLYAFMNLFLRVYMVDFVLKIETPAEKLLFVRDRHQGLFFICLCMVVPFAILHYLNYIKFAWRVRGASKMTIQGALIRKFLAFRGEVRGDLSQGTLILAMTRDCQQIVDNGYMEMFLLLKALGSILLMFAYQFIQPMVFSGDLRMTAVYAMLFYPVCLFWFVWYRSEKNFRLLEEMNETTDQLVCHVDNVVLSKEVIQDYDARQPFIAKFDALIAANNDQSIATGQLMLNNTYFASWLALIVVVGYTIKGGIEVIHGDVTLGIFLTNLSIFNEVGTNWGTVYNIILQLQASIPRLERITSVLNFPIDLPQRMNLFKLRRQNTKKLRIELAKTRCSKLIMDLLPIKVIDPVKLSHQVSIHVAAASESCDFSLSQGRLIYILGPHGEGKSTMLRLICGAELPPAVLMDGYEHLVFVPSHLRTLHVSSEPVFFEGSLYANLTLGVREGDPDADMDRVLRVVRRLGIPRRVREEIESKEVKLWHLRLSPTQRQLLSLARAFIANPEVMCVQKPIQAFDEFTAQKVMELFREFVDKRGLETTAGLSRPRTCIVTSSQKLEHQYADTIMVVKATGVDVVKDDEPSLA